MSPRLIIAVLLVAVAVVFVLQNREYTTIDFLFFEMRNRVWTAIITSMALGIAIDRLFLRWWDKRKAAKQAAGDD